MKDLTQLSDESLMLMYLEGDLQAFENLVRRYKKRIFSYALKFFNGNTMLAEDIFQETFLRIITVKKFNTLFSRPKFSSFIFTIARNLCIDQHRKNKRTTWPIQDSNLIEFSTEKGGSFAFKDAETLIINEESEKNLHKALDALSEEQKEVFLFRQQENLSFKEIAGIIKVSENTVKSRMRYAIQNISKVLSGKNEQGGKYNEMQ